jgi:dihydrolipoyl dehydrogenase
MDDWDVVVVGGGPGGYVAAIRAAQLKLKTALVEQETVGGVCLNWGCIPSKALLRSAQVLHLLRQADEFGFKIQIERTDLDPAVSRSRQIAERMVEGVRFLLGKNGVRVYTGAGHLISPQEVEVRPGGERLSTRNILLATGTRPRELPGMALDGMQVMGSRQALELRERPLSIVIIGAGAVGCEFAYLYNSYGAEVTLIEQMEHLLPLEDEEISRQLERAFKKQGIQILTSARVLELLRGPNDVEIAVEQNGERRSISAERVLVGIGVQGNSDGLGLEAIGVRTDRTWVPVDEHMETNVPGIYAAGDLTGPPLLAHVASAQGVVAVEHMAGLNPQPINYAQMPRATYCQPEVAAIGLTEAEARERYEEIEVGRFPFRANGRAAAIGESEGLVKVIADRETDQLLGIHMVGPEVSELLGEATLALAGGVPTSELGFAVHAHPTLSEALKEAALAARGEAIHVWQVPQRNL